MVENGGAGATPSRCAYSCANCASAGVNLIVPFKCDPSVLGVQGGHGGINVSPRSIMRLNILRKRSMRLYNMARWKQWCKASLVPRMMKCSTGSGKYRA
jgi:hypothetical protein